MWVSPPVVTPVEGTDAIYALAASSTRVYVGGAFTRVGGIHRQGLAALDAKTGRLLDWRTPPIHWEPSPEIDALALTGSRLYVGGALDSIGGQPRLSIAALDAGTGALLPWNPNPPVGDASTILVTHGEVITADFDGFAATSVRTGHRLSWTWRNGGEASTFVADWPLVYFAEELGPMGAFNLATGRVTNWYPDILFLNVSVSKIVPSGGQVLVLGEFTDWIG